MSKLRSTVIKNLIVMTLHVFFIRNLKLTSSLFFNFQFKAPDFWRYESNRFLRFLFSHYIYFV